MFEQLTKAYRDVVDGAKLAPLWGALGWDQTLARFRRTLLGPFWLSSTLLAMAISLSFVFGGLMGVAWKDNFPFVLFGILAWSIVGSPIAEAAGLFIGSAGMMQVQRFPLSFFAFLQMFRTLINFAAQGITAVVLTAALGLLHVPHWTLLPGIALVFLTSFFISIIVAIPSTRFRDVGHLMGLVSSILFFVTPLFWRPSQMSPARRAVVDYNPLAHEVALIREPLMGHAPTLADWAWSFGMLAVSAVVAILLLSVVRKRVVFWL